MKVVSAGLKSLLSLSAVLLVPHAAYCNGLALTAAGISDGFTLTTFATTDPGNTGCCQGPFGVAMLTSTTVIVANGGGTAYVFADTDGQTTASAISSFSFGSGTQAFATVGGNAYGGNGSQYVEFNANGTVNHVLSDLPSPYLGMWGNQTNGHIIAASSVGLIDIDPNGNGGLGSYRGIANIFPDGVSVSPDGTIAYVENNNTIQAYRISDGTLLATYSSFGTLSNPDGSGVISSTNSLNGDIIVNFNGNSFNTGGIGLIDPTTSLFTVIATGGTRGDYVSPDVANGTLFLDYGDTVNRLSCGSNCSIGSVITNPSPTPEPGSFVLLGTGVFSMAGVVRRKLFRS